MTIGETLKCHNFLILHLILMKFSVLWRKIGVGCIGGEKLFVVESLWERGVLEWIKFMYGIGWCDVV